MAMGTISGSGRKTAIVAVFCFVGFVAGFLLLSANENIWMWRAGVSLMTASATLLLTVLFNRFSAAKI